MFKAIQRFFGEGRPGFVQKLNEMVDALNALRQIRGDETFINVLHSAEGGLSVGLNINQVLSRIPKQHFNGAIPVRITDYDAANGYYLGYIQSRKNSGFSEGDPGDFSDDVDLRLSDYYQDSGAKVVVLNEAESRTPLRALRANGTEYVDCVATGTVSDALDPTSAPIYRCDVPFRSMVCRIDHTGSGDGAYTGVVLFGGCSLAVSTDANEVPSTMRLGTVQAILVHIPEIPGTANGPTGAVGHRLPTGSYVTGTFLDMSSDGTPVPVIAITGVIGRINTPKDLGDTNGGSYSSGIFQPNTLTWNWSTDASPLQLRLVTTMAYDGSSNAGGTAVTNGGSHTLVLPTRHLIFNAMGGIYSVDAEGSVGSALTIALKSVSVVSDVSLDGSGNLTVTKQNVWVIDYDAPGTPVIVVNAC